MLLYGGGAPASKRGFSVSKKTASSGGRFYLHILSCSRSELRELDVTNLSRTRHGWLQATLTPECQVRGHFVARFTLYSLNESTRMMPRLQTLMQFYFLQSGLTRVVVTTIISHNWSLVFLMAILFILIRKGVRGYAKKRQEKGVLIIYQKVLEPW